MNSSKGKNCGNIFDSIINQLYNTKKYNDLKYLLDLSNKEILKLSIDIMNMDQKRIFHDITNSYNKQQCSNDDDDDKNNSTTIFAIEGLPGTGKSFLQDVLHGFFLLQLQESSLLLNVKVVAPTNYIALQQRGVTLNRAVGDFCNKLKIRNYALDENVMALFQEHNIDVNDKTSLTQLVKNIHSLMIEKNDSYKSIINKKKHYIVLIDEGSMISSLSFALLLASYKYCYCRCTFIMFLGCNQLPPVSPALKLKCCFDVDWGENYPKNVYTLQTQMRFSDETQNIFREYVSYFNDYLNKKPMDKNYIFTKTEYFLQNLKIGGTLDDYHQSDENDKILIVATNNKRSNENNKRLNVKNQIFEIPAILGNQIPNKYDVYNNLGIDAILKISLGAVCIFKANLLNIGMVKGMVVTVVNVQVDPETKIVDNITVEDTESKNQQIITRHGFETQYSGQLIYQFPITLGYAITAHCAQGKTLTSMVGVDLEGSASWNLIKNLFFVAITRVQFSNQLFMDKHPAFWLFPLELELNTLEEVKEYLFPSSSPPPPKRLKSNSSNNNDDDEKIYTTNIYDVCQKMIKNYYF